MENTEFREWLNISRAPVKMLRWAETLDYDPSRLYEECDQWSWLLWWAQKSEVSSDILTEASRNAAAWAAAWAVARAAWETDIQRKMSDIVRWYITIDMLITK